ncbi:MAG: PilX N-terminal domain-containing pilus assembly protein [Candidatus Binatia bacterium]
MNGALTPQRRFVRDQDGCALVASLLLLVLLLTLAGAVLLLSTLDLRSTSHYRTGNQALFAAESGLLHALSTMNERGVQSFEEVAAAQTWNGLYGPSLKTIPNYPQFSYKVGVAADAADPVNRGSITVTGSAPLQAERVVRIALVRSNAGGLPGALYLSADTIDSATFQGNAFGIDGNDHTVLGDANPSGPLKPGIATRNDGVAGTVTNSLSNQQKDNVQGLGFSLDPLTPSVRATGGPTVNDLDQILASILANAPGAVTSSQSAFNGNDTFGTLAAPQVTHLTDPNVRLNGNATGAGVLIVDGSLTVSGDLNFVGWIIVRGDTVINVTGNADDGTIVLGNATIRGALWTGHLQVQVGGSAIIDYCDACLRLVADSASGNLIGNVPRPMSVVSWQEL